jgi:hypothetical protein
MSDCTTAGKDKIMWICVAIGIAISFSMLLTEGTFV